MNSLSFHTLLLTGMSGLMLTTSVVHSQASTSMLNPLKDTFIIVMNPDNPRDYKFCSANGVPCVSRAFDLTELTTHAKDTVTIDIYTQTTQPMNEPGKKGFLLYAGQPYLGKSDQWLALYSKEGLLPGDWGTFYVPLGLSVPPQGAETQPKLLISDIRIGVRGKLTEITDEDRAEVERLGKLPVSSGTEGSVDGAGDKDSETADKSDATEPKTPESEPAVEPKPPGEGSATEADKPKDADGKPLKDEVPSAKPEETGKDGDRGEEKPKVEDKKKVEEGDTETPVDPEAKPGDSDGSPPVMSEPPGKDGADKGDPAGSDKDADKEPPKGDGKDEPEVGDKAPPAGEGKPPVVLPVPPDDAVTQRTQAATVLAQRIAGYAGAVPSNSALAGLGSIDPQSPLAAALPDTMSATELGMLIGDAQAGIGGGLASLGVGGAQVSVPLAKLQANLTAGRKPGAALAALGGVPSAALPGRDTQPMWAQLTGAWQEIGSNGGAPAVRQRTAGLYVGGDGEVSGGWRLGAAVGYADSRSTVQGRAASANISTYSLTLYGGKAFELPDAQRVLWSFGGSYNWHDIGSTRHATLASGPEKLSADYGASSVQLFSELGYVMPLADGVSAEPYVQLIWSDLRTRGYQERGGLSVLRGMPSRSSTAASTLGLRLRTDLDIGGVQTVAHASAGWRHGFGDTSVRSKLAFAGGAPFTLQSAPLATNTFALQLGANAALGRSVTLGLTYDGQFGSGLRQHALTANMRWAY